MPKPVKKARKSSKPKQPAKPKRPTDPNRAAHSMLAEHMARAEAEQEEPASLNFTAQYKAHMAKLGSKGGKISGAKRMEMPVEERRRIASLAARAMWEKRKRPKKEAK